MGKNAHSLRLNCDCLGHIWYFDAHQSTWNGGVETIEQAICMHEEDQGLLWKHQDWRAGGQTHSKRARRLEVSFICTIANYDYRFAISFKVSTCDRAGRGRGLTEKKRTTGRSTATFNSPGSCRPAC